MSDPKTEQVTPDSVVETLPAKPPDESIDPQAMGLEIPEDSEEAIAFLVSEVAKARDDASSYLDDLQRVAADFDNYRKRSVRELATTHQRAAEKIVHSLLPVLDTFDAAGRSPTPSVRCSPDW